MKINYIFNIFFGFLLVGTTLEGLAQAKFGANPASITTKTHVETEGITGKKNVITDSSKVGIGTVSPSVALEINSGTANKSGVRLASLPSSSTATAGAAPLGIDASGNVGIAPAVNVSGTESSATTGVTQNVVNKDCLGYEPSGKAANVPATGLVTGTTVTYNKIDTKIFAANGHTYVSFKLSAGVSWQDGFALAKALGGYLVTITNDDEWIFIKNNFLVALQHNIWLGYNKVLDPGNTTLLTWVTCEKSRITWSNDAYTQPYAWNSGEPNNGVLLGNEGCGHIVEATTNTQRTWNDLACSNTTAYSVAIDQLIIEFHQ